jgi:hypothetical protein
LFKIDEFIMVPHLFGGGGFEPLGGGFDPLGGGFDPLGGGFDPLGGGFDPLGGGFDPLGGGFEPLGGGFDPSQETGFVCIKVNAFPSGSFTAITTLQQES